MQYRSESRFRSIKHKKAALKKLGIRWQRGGHLPIKFITRILFLLLNLKKLQIGESPVFVYCLCSLVALFKVNLYWYQKRFAFIVRNNTMMLLCFLHSYLLVNQCLILVINFNFLSGQDIFSKVRLMRSS